MCFRVSKPGEEADLDTFESMLRDKSRGTMRGSGAETLLLALYTEKLEKIK